MSTRRPFRNSTGVRAAALLLGLAATVGASEAKPSGHKWIHGYGELPLSFEANQGQTDPTVSFVSRGPGYTLFLTPTEAVLALRQPDKGTRVLRMKTAGATPAAMPAGVDRLPGRSHYFIGNDPAKWRTGIPTYARVEYREVYPGVSLVYHGHGRQLEYDFVVAPGADPKAIALVFDGAEGPTLDARGDLVLDGGRGEIRVHRPVIYQDGEKGRAAVDGRFVIKDSGRVAS